MLTKQLCIILGKKNKDLKDRLDDRRLEWDLSFPDTLDRLEREHRFYESVMRRS